MNELERIDAALRVHLDVLRHSAYVEGAIVQLIEQMRAELISKLASANLTNWSKARLNQLLHDSEVLIASYYTQAQSALAPTYSLVANAVAAQTAAGIVGAALPSKAVLESLVGNVLIDGTPTKLWWEKLGQDEAFKFKSAVRQGIAQGETQAQIFKRANEIMGLVGRNSKALVHTSIMQTLNDAAVATFERNADLTPTVRHLATLDSSTCWSAETLVLMADGTQKRTDEVRVGDMVIGGTSGEPRKVLAVGKRIVLSSVAIYNDCSIIGRATHDHPVLTETGWKEIGTLSLSADVSKREVLCRSFLPPSILEIGKGSNKNKSALKFELEGKHHCSKSTPKVRNDYCEDGTICKERLAIGSAPRESECCAGKETGGIARNESNMGSITQREGVACDEGEMGEPGIPCQNESTEAACTISRIARKGRCWETEGNDPRNESLSIGEDAPILGKTERVSVGTIYGEEINAPVEVFSFEIEIDHSYVAGGIIVHNCVVCGARDGLEWDTLTHEPIGHNLPYIIAPLHFGCRCKMVGVTKIDKFVQGQRASMFGPVDRKVKFGDFLSRQTQAFQEDVLGKGRAELFRSGKLTLNDLVSGSGSPLSLKQLEKKYTA